MSFADQYLSKQIAFIDHIKEPPSGLLRFIVIIPANLEENIIDTLLSIEKCETSDYSVEIIVLVNHSENDCKENKLKNLEIFIVTEQWCKQYYTTNKRYYCMYAPDLPAKHAGAGLARKIAMDEAVYRFNSINNKKGLILSLDADTLVESSYFEAIDHIMFNDGKYGGCNIRFEHPTEGTGYSPEIFDGIIQYELHLRYYRHMLRYIGFPYAYYTIGSCFGVFAEFYTEQGGMNRRTAGEDFYFLNKLFPHRNFAEVNNTCVYPSPRPSMRVPFGTGATITKLLTEKKAVYLTYSPDAFYDLKSFLSISKSFFKEDYDKIAGEIINLPPGIQRFLTDNQFLKKIQEIKQNTTSEEAFRKRFFQWFDGFRIVKFLNEAHINYYTKIPVKKAVFEFLLKTNTEIPGDSARDLLEILRHKDKGGVYFGKTART